MRVTKWAKLAILGAMALLAPSLSGAADKPYGDKSRGNWTATVTRTDDGQYVLGNPNAPIKLTEFVSYTCPHCATFQKQADTTLRVAYVSPGKVSIKIQHVMRDPADMTVAMLTNCGDTAGFFKRHHFFLYGQDKWLTKMGTMSEAQMGRWNRGGLGDRLKAVAADFGFYETMSQWGYSRVQVEKCLADQSMADRIVAQTSAARMLGVPGTPSFAIGGDLLAGTHEWKTLKPQLKARM